MVNVILLENILSLKKYKGLSYHTHFLKIAGSGIGDNFLEYSLKQANIFVRQIVSQTFSLQIEQNVYSVGTYRAPEAAQILVKMYRKIAKSHIFESASFFFYSSTFSGYKDVCRAVNGRRVYQSK